MAKRSGCGWWSKQTETEIVSSLVSFVCHVVIILFLFFCVEKIDKQKPLAINFSISDTNESPVVIESKFPEPTNSGAESLSGEINDGAVFVYTDVDPINIENPDIPEIKQDQQPIEIIEKISKNDEEVSYDTNQKEPQRNDLDIYGFPKNEGSDTSLVSSSNGSSSGIEGSGTVENKFGKRLSEKGAQTGDVQVSIVWDSYDDIDLWVDFATVGGRNRGLINWTQTRDDIYGGWLDVDCNVSPTTTHPVENIFWPKNQAPYGTYNVYIHFFHQWSNRKNIPVQIRILVDGKVEYRKALVSYGSGVLKVYSFTRKIKKPVPTYR